MGKELWRFEERREDVKYSSQNGEECVSDGACQLSYVIFSIVCLGEGIEIVARRSLFSLNHSDLKEINPGIFIRRTNTDWPPDVKR